MRFTSVAAVCLGCLLLPPATGAVAHQYSAPTTTSFKYKDGEFRGRVDSPRDACISQRKVKLVRHTDSDKEVVGRTRSNSKGRWRIDQPNAAGTYNAVVVRRFSAPTGHVHQCQRGASTPTTVVDP